MSKSKRRPAEKRPKPKVDHKSFRRNVKHRLRLGMVENLPQVPKKIGDYISEPEENER